MATMVQKKWIKQIHIAKTFLKLDDVAYRGVLSGAACVDSSTEIQTWEQFNSIMAAFNQLGFPPKKPLLDIDRDKDRISYAQEKYIKGLWNLASRKKDDKSLRQIIFRITGIDDISFLKKKDATKVIIALRKIASAEGFNPDQKEG